MPRIQRLLLATLSAALASQFPSIASPGLGRAMQGGIVVTSAGIFESCDVAIAYRDGPLVELLDLEFQRYDRGVQSRVDTVAEDFEAHAAAARASYEDASSMQKREVAYRVGRYFALRMLARSLESSPALANLTEAERRIATGVSERAVAQAEVLARSGFGETPPLKDVIGPHAGLVIDIVSAGLGPAALAIVKVVQAADAGGDIALAYMGWEIVKAQASSDERRMLDALDALVRASPKARVREINGIKAQVDKACNQGL